MYLHTGSYFSTANIQGLDTSISNLYFKLFLKKLYFLDRINMINSIFYFLSFPACPAESGDETIKTQSPSANK
jgi:hypothetical protein